MGLASSSAVRRDDAYGSLGGLSGSAFGGLGGTERKLKKQPVLVLDPDELAKAHMLFQIGAAEQLGEFDPKERANRPAPVTFSPILGSTPYQDEDDDYVAPVDLGEDDEEPEDDLPPIDLDALLALTRAEQEEEDAFYREEPELEELDEASMEAEAEPAEPAEPEIAEISASPVECEHEPIAAPSLDLPAAEAAEIAAPEAISPADALARIINRAASQPKLAPEPGPAPVEELPAFALPEPEPEAEIAPALPEPEPEREPLETMRFADEPILAGTLEEPFDLSPQDEFDGEAFVRPEAPLRMLPIIMGEEGTRSTLRARLVREDLTLARPEPSAWRKLVNALRRWRARF